MTKRFIFTLFIIFVAIFSIYYLSSPGESPYNYFTRLSQSFSQGKLYLNENPPWLNELIPMNNKYYVVYPPMPAILLEPVVFLFGINTQTMFSVILASVNVVLVYFLLKKLNFSTVTILLVTIFFAFGTNHWYLASIGSAWFLAHVVALFFLLLSLIEVFGKKRLLLIGLLLGASFWSRSTEIFTLPFFYIIFLRSFWPINKRNITNFFIFNSGILFFVILDSGYNFARFGNFSILTSYQLIPNINNDPIFREGFMNIKYIPRHVDALLFRLPKLVSNFPYLIPSLYSTAIWFTSPAIIYIFKAQKSFLSVACWIGILIPIFVIFLWGGIGFAQFGYRFILDVIPFILILIAHGIGQKPNKIVYLLIFLSIIANAWGVILINKFSIFTI